MSCACGWDKLCSVGRRLWKLLKSCNDWMGVREAGTYIKISNTRYSIISCRPSFYIASVDRLG